MRPSLDQICCAKVPLTQLAALGSLRREREIRVLVRGEHAWVRWPVELAEVLRQIFPISGCVLYAPRDGHWYQLGQHLPTFTIPREWEIASVPLATALVPAPIDVALPDRPTPQPALLQLVRDERFRPARGLRCRLESLSAWAETVPTSRITALQAAIATDQVLVLGTSLPAVAEGTRYWGDEVLIPLGFRSDPGLSDDALRRALNIAHADLLLLTPEGSEVVPFATFRPLTRAGIRLAERSLRT